MPLNQWNSLRSYRVGSSVCPEAEGRNETSNAKEIEWIRTVTKAFAWRHCPWDETTASATSSGTGVRGALCRRAERPKSLMKRAGLATRGAAKQKAPAAGHDGVRQKSTSRPALNGRNQKVEERIAAAQRELASGISQSASAAAKSWRA